jgi:predicted Zn-dependent protease
MLSADFSANGLKELAFKWAEIALQKYPKDHRIIYNYAMTLFALDRKEECHSILDQLTQMFPVYPNPYPFLINYYNEMDDSDSLYRTLLRMEQAYLKQPALFQVRISQENLNIFFKLLADLRAQHNE